MSNTARLILIISVLNLAACSDTAQRIAAAREVLAELRFRETLELSRQHPPDTGARNREAMNRCYRETSTEPVVAQVAQRYADTLSLSELLELKAFYRSPAGKRGVQKDIEDGYRRRLLVPPEVTVRGPEDEAALAAFARRPVVRKLSESGLLNDVATLLRISDREMMANCEKNQPS